MNTNTATKETTMKGYLLAGELQTGDYLTLYSSPACVNGVEPSDINPYGYRDGKLYVKLTITRSYHGRRVTDTVTHAVDSLVKAERG